MPTKLEGKRHFVGLGTDRKIILKWILKMLRVGLWAEFISLRIPALEFMIT
jgi:hypothetical protein